MKSINSSRGVIPYLALLACLILLFVLFIVSQWNQKTKDLISRVEVLEKSVASFENKLKYLELKSAADDVVQKKPR